MFGSKNNLVYVYLFNKRVKIKPNLGTIIKQDKLKYNNVLCKQTC